MTEKINAISSTFSLLSLLQLPTRGKGLQLAVYHADGHVLPKYFQTYHNWTTKQRQWSLRTHPELWNCCSAFLTFFIKLIITPFPATIFSLMKTPTGAWDSPDLRSTRTQNLHLKQTVSTVDFRRNSTRTSSCSITCHGDAITLLKLIALPRKSCTAVVAINNVNTSTKNSTTVTARAQEVFSTFLDLSVIVGALCNIFSCKNSLFCK